MTARVMGCRLAIFDFDGTLADSFPFFLSVFNTIADRHGFRRIDVERAGSLRHYGTREMVKHVCMPMWKLPLASKTFMAMMKDSAGSIRLFDGIPDALHSLARGGIRLAVVSSNSEDNVRRVLGPELAALFGSFDCGMSVFGKASRIRQAIKDAGIGPLEAIYIGDQGTDAEAARKAGAHFGAVHWGYATIEALRAHLPSAEFAAPFELAALVAQPA